MRHPDDRAVEAVLSRRWWTIDELCEHFVLSRTAVNARLLRIASRALIFKSGGRGWRNAPARYRMYARAYRVAAVEAVPVRRIA